ncbi:MAG: biopolymer transporter ExbD [Thermoguttaceae bacterium]|nr:biopolymer transporter ExbD [Thermoguttaceae bacterium]MDW8079569.1 biopolymer transporter ExbD [Thermoguttaceae bacterium]
MRTPFRRPQASFGFNMTPLVDIVFQLVVFFLVASHLAQQETALELDLPAAQSAEADVPSAFARVIINVPPDGEGYWVAGEKLDVDALRRLLQAEVARRGTQCQVRIRCDRRVPYSRLEPILTICTELGITDVTLATVEK